MSGSGDVMSTAEAARRLGYSSGRLSQLKKLGMPVLPDGQVSLNAVQSWMMANLSSSRNAKIHTTALSVPMAPAMGVRSSHNLSAAEAEGPRMNSAAKDLLKRTLSLALGDLDTVVAVMAVEAGAPMRIAFATATGSVLGTWEKVEERLREVGVLDDGEELVMNLEAATNWPVLAAKAGEPVDLEAWRAYAAERFRDDAGPAT